MEPEGLLDDLFRLRGARCLLLVHQPQDPLQDGALIGGQGFQVQRQHGIGLVAQGP